MYLGIRIQFATIFKAGRFPFKKCLNHCILVINEIVLLLENNSVSKLRLRFKAGQNRRIFFRHIRQGNYQSRWPDIGFRLVDNGDIFGLSFV